jgi:hypothetical protein
MRRVWPSAFLLFGASLDEAHQQNRTVEALAVLRRADPKAKLPLTPGAPMALRWVTSPDLGFPRVPFTVWRRFRGPLPRAVLFSNKITVANSTVAQFWALGEMYDVEFDVAPTGAGVTVDALDVHGRPLPGQRLVLTVATVGAFRAPGIAGLRVRGQGTVGPARGTAQIDVANLQDWERVQLVGLPFKGTEIAAPFYNPVPQGWALPRDGYDASLLRLQLARIMQLPLPSTGVADIPTPAWPAADPAGFLNLLRVPNPLATPLKPLVSLIDACLRNTNDANAAQVQALYQAPLTLPGIHQADIPGSAPDPLAPSLTNLPVVAVTLLGAASDSDAATALGYGTIDIAEVAPQAPGTSTPGTPTPGTPVPGLPVPGLPGPGTPGSGSPAPATRFANIPKIVYPPGTIFGTYDYMVTAPFVLPFGIVDLAALLQMPPRPAPANDLRAARLQGNRPPARDAARSESVQLSWLLSDEPQGWGVLVSRAPGTSAMLNAARGPGVGGFDPFTPLRPEPVDGQSPAGARTIFTDPVSPVPLAGSAVSRYMAIGRNSFGLWSPWRLVPSTATAPPVQVPGLFLAELRTDVVARTGRVVPASLEVTLAWDWSDRSPARIEVVGTFVPPSGPLPVAPPTGVPSTPAARVVIGFESTTGTPAVLSAHSATVVQIPDPSGAPPDIEHRRYLLTLSGLSCDYTSAHDVALAVWARGAEHVRPTDASAFTSPLVARAPDPIPPDPPTMPPLDILWTALPDATGKGRAVLRWPAVPAASGYIVWEAAEVALRHAVDPAAVPVADSTLLQRALALRSLIGASTASAERSLFAFTRLQERAIPTNEVEVVLPGSADTLYAYRVSAITPTNVESPRSAGMVFVAVPRRVVPGRPRVLLRTVPGGIEVIVLPGLGGPAAGFRIHRVRRLSLAAEVGMMGPPVIDETHSGWAPRSVLLSPRSTEEEHGMSIIDPVPASWYPYHYRVVAVGAADPPNGAHAGESPASATAAGLRPPPNPPVLDNLATVGNVINKVVTFRTDLPIRMLPVGAAQIEVLKVAAPAPGARLERSTVLRIHPMDVVQGAPLPVIFKPSRVSLAAMPEIRRSAPDAQGRCTYSVRMRADVGDGVIVVTDPRARSTERDMRGL